MRILVVLAALVFISACVQQTPITEITLEGQGDQVYVFSYDIRESVKVKSADESSIRNLLGSTDSINLVYNDTQEDLPVFNVALFNIREKLRTYDAYQGVVLKFYPFYHTPDGLVNFSNASVNNPSVEIKGPNTGAVETSVTLNGRTILAQGTDSRSVQLAADKLVLIFFDIDERKVEAMGRKQ